MSDDAGPGWSREGECDLPSCPPFPYPQALTVFPSALAPDEHEDSSIFSYVHEVPICLGAPILSSLLWVGRENRQPQGTGWAAGGKRNEWNVGSDHRQLELLGETLKYTL